MTITGFKGMFGDGWDAPVERIEIPMFQRDYAQGREEESVREIREAFVSALCQALLEDAKPLGLDFVFGEVDGATKTLVPLDGQQRLTTLFLLHWYVAHRAKRLNGTESWTRFSYRTRPSAELFCRTLVTEFAKRPVVGQSLTAWIREQSWFLYAWRFDPTIRGMLVVIDTIAATCEALEVDFPTAWERLSAPDPAIWFHYRPIEDMGAETDLYIKMNSRGKPLTPWESVKAHFEEAISWTTPERRHQFALGFDGSWSDVFWKLRTAGEPPDAMDARFLRHFTFLTDICRWSAGPTGGGDREVRQSLAQRITALFGQDGTANLNFLFASFDVWTSRDPISTFERLYRPPARQPSDGSDPLLLFFDGTGLFSQCCDHYGTEEFTIPQMLILYATLVHLTDPGEAAAQFPAHVRTLRNLIQATSIQRKDLPRLIPEVKVLIQTGQLSDESGFNRVQVEQERAKRRLLARHPQDHDLAATLHGLEDHRLLRGSLAAFDMDVDAATFTRRARTFAQVFTPDADRWAISGALLAQGDYGWRRSSIHRQYGSGDAGDAPWRELLTNNDQQDRLAGTRAVVMSYLDEAAESHLPAQYARRKAERWLEERREGPFDWRYYFVKYGAMRTDTSGVFHLPDDRLAGRRLRPGQNHQASKQRDPYLVAIHQELGADKDRFVEQRAVWWLEMYLNVKDNPQVRLRNVQHGFRIEMPSEVWPFFEDHLQRQPVGAEVGSHATAESAAHVTVFAGIPRDPATPRADRLDRVQVGAALCAAMVAAVRGSTG